MPADLSDIVRDAFHAFVWMHFHWASRIVRCMTLPQAVSKATHNRAIMMK
jgi:hypothetical protein